MNTNSIASVFLDPNIFVSWVTESSEFHDNAVDTVRKLRDSGSGRFISVQVLHEFFSTSTWLSALSLEEVQKSAIGSMKLFRRAFAVLPESSEVGQILIELLEQTKTSSKQIHDANIVATMISHDVTDILTNNPGNFEHFSPQITVLPLMRAETS